MVQGKREESGVGTLSAQKGSAGNINLAKAEKEVMKQVRSGRFCL